VKNLIQDVEVHLAKDGIKLNSKKYAFTTFSSNFHPELDTSPIPSYEAMIFSATNWNVTLDNCCTVLLSSYFMQPYEGHLQEE
jgi:hypothetical protein